MKRILFFRSCYMLKKILLLFLICFLLSGCGEVSSELDSKVKYIKYQNKEIKLYVNVDDFLKQFEGLGCMVNYLELDNEYSEIINMSSNSLYISCDESLNILAMLMEDVKLANNNIHDWRITGDERVSILIEDREILMNVTGFEDSGIIEVLGKNYIFQNDMIYYEFDKIGYYFDEDNGKFNYLNITRYF